MSVPLRTVLSFLAITTAASAATGGDPCLQGDLTGFRYRFRDPVDNRVLEVNFLTESSATAKKGDHNSSEMEVTDRAFWCKMMELVDKLKKAAKSSGVSRPRPPDSEVAPVTAIFGGRADLRCAVQDGSDVTLLWERDDGSPLPASAHQTDGLLVMAPLSKTDEAVYTCTGQRHGQTLFTAQTRLLVVAPPRVRLTQARQVFVPGDDVTIMCSATGDEPIVLEWEAVGRGMPASATIHGGELKFRGLSTSDAGRYLCRASNAVGVGEQYADVTVDGVSRPRPPDSEMKAMNEGRAVHSCAVQGHCGVSPCFELRGESKCYCRLGTTGDRCQDDLQLTRPAAFVGDGFIALKTPKALRRSRFDLLFKFKPADVSGGLLAYIASSNGSHGDFMAVSIHNRVLEFRMKIDLAITIVRASQELVPWKWTTATLRRDRETIQMTIDGKKQQQTVEFPSATHVRKLTTALYLGGLDRRSLNVSRDVGVTEGFQGCIDKVQIGKKNFNILKTAVDAANIKNCRK